MRKLTISFLFISSICTAQTDSVSTVLEEVVFTSQRNSVKTMVIPYTVYVTERNSVERFNDRTVPEALMHMTGAFVQKTNHGGGSVFLRGLTGNQSLILIDGIRLNNSIFRYGPNQYLNTIDPFTVDKIEVAKGTGSVQFGSDAMGGVINILPRNATYTETAEVAGKTWLKGTSSNMEKTIRSEIHWSGKKSALMMGGTISSFGDLFGGDTTNRQIPSGYKQYAIDARLHKKFGKTEVIIAHQFLQQDDVPLYHKVVLENFFVNQMDPQRRALTYLKSTTPFNNKFFSKLEVTLSMNSQLETRLMQKNGSTMLRIETDKAKTLGVTADFLTTIKRNWNTNSGFEFYYDWINSSRIDKDLSSNQKFRKRGLYPNGATYGNFSAYTLHHYQFDKLKIEAGLRFNAFDIRTNDTGIANGHITPTALVGNLALLYSIDNNHNVYASFNSGFRAPNIDDMSTLGIVDFRYEVPATSLSPERSINFELGYKLATKNVTASFAAFHMILQDLITRIRTKDSVAGYAVYIKQNTERAYIRGFESELKFMPSSAFHFETGISYLFGQNKTINEPLRRIPPLHGRAAVSYTKNNFYLVTEYLAAGTQDRLAKGDKDDNRIPTGGTPGWTIVNFHAGYEFKFMQARATLLNVSNEDYRTHGSGINGMGRAVSLTLIFKY